jgi:hypothetical protein
MNIMGRLVMRPPILLVRSCFIIFLRVPFVSYRKAFYYLLGDPWVNEMNKVRSHKNYPKYLEYNIIIHVGIMYKI